MPFSKRAYCSRQTILSNGKVEHGLIKVSGHSRFRSAIDCSFKTLTFVPNFLKAFYRVDHCPQFYINIII